MRSKALPITGDGTETRDWTYVGDLINGLLAAGVKDEAIGEAINLGSGTETHVIDMAHEVNRLAGNALGVMYTQRRDWDAKTRLISSIDKAQKLLGYRPRTTFNKGLKHVHEWFVDNWENIQRSAEF
jgi:nucleoside-diphosphate-sugar epimerase